MLVRTAHWKKEPERDWKETYPPSLPNRSGMPRDVSLPFPPTRAGASETTYQRDRRDTDALWLPQCCCVVKAGMST
jgi:hypothetical protein